MTRREQQPGPSDLESAQRALAEAHARQLESAQERVAKEPGAGDLSPQDAAALQLLVELDALERASRELQEQVHGRLSRSIDAARGQRLSLALIARALGRSRALLHSWVQPPR